MDNLLHDAVGDRPGPLVATLVMSPEQFEKLREESTALELARAYKIDPAAPLEDQALIADVANKELKSVKGRIAAIEKIRDAFIAPGLQIIETAKGFFNPPLKALKESEAFLKTELLSYSDRVEAARQEAERARREEERLARQKAEQEAAAARARAEAAAAEQRRKAEEAEAARRKAEQEGNARAAAAAAAAKAKAEEAERAAIENGEAKATQAILTASAQPSTAVAPVEAPKLAGFSTRDNWVAEIAQDVSDESYLVRLLVAQIAGVNPASLARPELLALLAYESKAANKLAKALKSGMNVRGLVARNKPVAASRAA